MCQVQIQQSHCSSIHPEMTMELELQVTNCILAKELIQPVPSVKLPPTQLSNRLSNLMLLETD